jgi:hypothetical protein
MDSESYPVGLYGLSNESGDKYIRCTFCLRLIKTEFIIGVNALQQHDDVGGRRCMGSGKSFEEIQRVNTQWDKLGENNKKFKERLAQVLERMDMPKNIGEDHKAFGDIIKSDAPVAIKLKEKIKNGTIFFQGRSQVEKNTEPYKCPVCNEPVSVRSDCFHGHCKKSKHKPIKCSVEIIED